MDADRNYCEMGIGGDILTGFVHEVVYSLYNYWQKRWCTDWIWTVEVLQRWSFVKNSAVEIEYSPNIGCKDGTRAGPGLQVKPEHGRQKCGTACKWAINICTASIPISKDHVHGRQYPIYTANVQTTYVLFMSHVQFVSIIKTNCPDGIPNVYSPWLAFTPIFTVHV